MEVNKQIPSESTTLANLDFHNDQFVVFTTQTSAVAAQTAPLTPSQPIGPETTHSLYTSNPNLSTLDTDLAIRRAPSFDYLQGVMSKESSGLSDLAPFMPDQSMFMQPNSQSKPPNTVEDVRMELSAAGFDMHEYDTLPDAGASSVIDFRDSSNAMPEQGSQGDHDSPRTPNRAVDLNSSSGYVPRTIPNVFGEGDLAESQSASAQTSLQRLLQDSLPERLEAAVAKGITILKEVEEPLVPARRDGQSQQWLEQIKLGRDLAKTSRTVIGVVGNTGAGKSSVINALLEEERLVPTNCMRACTAVVTELSYNETENEDAKYRAEIEFIQPEDWRRELAVLFEEVFDTKGLSKDAHNPESIAGVAYAKIRAVYHKHTKDMLQKSTIEQLMNVPDVGSILGTVKRINSRDCASFYQRLQHYVDSQQKLNGNKGVKPKREFQHWPLIKVVRIYTKADALSTGAVIVDLPGVHDSNAARAAVAEGYIKECSGLWIVAPITRAVDDKAAKNLLGSTFKRQLKYDGSYAAMTFICSKTDDISTTEAADSLQLGDVMADQEAERENINRKTRAAKGEKRKMQTERDDQDDLIEQYEEHITNWENVLRSVENDESSDDATASLSNKRKRSTDLGSAMMSDEQSLTAQQVRSKIEEQTKLRRSARQHGQKLRDDITKIQKTLNDLDSRRTQIEKDAEALCIQGRNDWSRERIREDFAEGVRELDQENAAEENPDDFDPEEEIQDYGDVARSLPVFCVSSRAYQKLSGRLQKDGDTNGFTSPSQTEIPQLQAHCRKLTEAGRQGSCKAFLNNLSRLLTSLSLWASDDGSQPESSTHQRKKIQAFVTKNLQKLQQQLERAVDDTMDDIEQALDHQLYNFFASAVHTAAKAALPISDEWGAPRDQGGMFWATYKATVRRHGVFHGAAGHRDFNKDLTNPFTKSLMTRWEKTFHRRVPEVFNGFPIGVNDTIKNFHDALEQQCVDQNSWNLRIARLRENVVILEAAFNDLAKQTISNVNEAQREINREFTPSVAAAMATAYDQCSEENGKPTFISRY